MAHVDIWPTPAYNPPRHMAPGKSPGHRSVHRFGLKAFLDRLINDPHVLQSESPSEISLHIKIDRDLNMLLCPRTEQYGKMLCILD